MSDLSFKGALAKAEHLVALGNTTVYLRDDSDFPWDKASDIEAGCGYRLNGPTSFYVVAHEGGLRFLLNVDFEGRDANGTSASQFDRSKLREITQKLPAATRCKLGTFLQESVLPEMVKRTAEWRGYLNTQADSEDCVRGLIAYALEAK